MNINIKEDLWQNLMKETRPIVLYGIGNNAEKVLKVLEEKNIRVSGIFASDEFVRDKNFHGYKLESLKEIENRLKDFVILLCFGTHLKTVIDSINEISKKHDLYVPDFNVCNEEYFTIDYFKKHEEDFNAAYQLLEDEESKKVFVNTIKYKLSGKLDYLYEVESSEVSSWELALGKDILLDLGAYTGDTADLYIKLNKEYKKIYAIEPGKRNYKKLCEYAQGIKNLLCFNIGIGDKNEILDFPDGSGRGSSTKKYTKVEFQTIDSFCENNLTKNELSDLLLKMDLEGYEEKAIQGAKNTIEKYHPNLYIAAYHKSEDLYKIPKMILSYYPGYKVFLRHSPCIPAWEMNYIFIEK